MRVAYRAEVRGGAAWMMPGGGAAWMVPGGGAAWMMLGVVLLLLLLQLFLVLFLLTLLVFLRTPPFSSSTGANASDLSMQSRLCQFI